MAEVWWSFCVREGALAHVCGCAGWLRTGSRHCGGAADTALDSAEDGEANAGKRGVGE